MSDAIGTYLQFKIKVTLGEIIKQNAKKPKKSPLTARGARAIKERLTTGDKSLSLARLQK